MRTYALALLLLMPSLAFGQYGGDKSNTTPAAGATPTIATYCAGSHASTTPTTANCNTPSAPTIAATGDPLVLYVKADSGVTLGSPSGCATWGAAKASDATNNQYVWVAAATASGSCTPTITGTSVSGTKEIDIYMWDTQNTLTTVDGTPGLVSTAFCTTCTGANTSSSSTGGLALGVVRAGAVTSFSGSWTGLTILTPNGLQMAGAYQVQAGSGSLSLTWNSSGQSAYDLVIILKHS